ncbi:hypothetical protein ACFU78_09775 [Streptomyces tendae]
MELVRTDLLENEPPGTGKSQTITNIIAGLIHAGRSCAVRE